MKAFVIKNKEGEYKTENDGVEIQSCFLRDIRCAEMFTDKEVAESFCPSDCEVAKIAIVEGDLQEINEQLNKNLIEMEQSKLRWENKYFKLEKQLTEKDKEINKLSEEHFEMFGDMKDYKNLWLAEQRKNKEIRKQVCDEIREKILIRLELPKEEWVWYSDDYVGVGLIKEILDQIEQG